MDKKIFVIEMKNSTNIKSLYYFNDYEQAYIKNLSLNETNNNHNISYRINELYLYNYDKKCSICSNLSTITFNDTLDNVCIKCFNEIKNCYLYNSTWGEALSILKNENN